MPDQAAQLRKLVRVAAQADPSLAPGGPIVALTGGRAEMGVTTVACQLARELARLGKQVVLVDANILRSGVAAHFGIDSRADQTLDAVLRGARRAVEVLVEVDDNIRILPGVLAGEQAPPLDRQAVDHLSSELLALSQQSDAILIDAGSGMNPWVDRLWQLARQVLLVATPESEAFLDAYAAVKLSEHRRHDGKIRLVLNRTVDDWELAPLATRFQDTCTKFLRLTPKQAAALPEFIRTKQPSLDSTAVTPHSAFSTQHSAFLSDEPFRRATRLLAADLAADFRVAALRLVKPKQLSASSFQYADKRDLTQRR
jgi:MinD-like ATPase involved in chromosome partitioning or flagellar assembly